MKLIKKDAKGFGWFLVFVLASAWNGISSKMWTTIACICIFISIKTGSFPHSVMALALLAVQDILDAIRGQKNGKG